MRHRAIAILAVCAATMGAWGGSSGAAAAGTGDSPMTPGHPEAAPGLAGAGRSDRRRALEPDAGPLRRLSIDCRRWRTLADHLGETLAGRRMRQAATAEACLEHDAGAAHIWDWPWAGGALSATLPPLLVAESGAWQVRCDTVSRRKRCALVHQPARPAAQADAGAGQGAGTGASGIGGPLAGISTHFIIDSIARRESVVWRVFVPAGARRAPVDGLAGHAARQGAADTGLPSSAPGATGRGPVLKPGLRLSIVGDQADKPGGRSHCTPVGCLVEAAPRRSAQLANRLSDGMAVEIRIHGEKDAAMTIPADGFRAGFRELARQRREEERGPR